MVTINKQTPTAEVVFKTAEGRDYCYLVKCTEARKEAARTLVMMPTGETLEKRISIWDLAKNCERVFGEDIANELMLAFATSEVQESKGKDGYGLPLSYGISGLWGMFVFSDTPQGHEFWTAVSEAAEAIVNA